MKLIIDSSVFISYLNKNDSLHNQTVIFLQKTLVDKKIIIILPIIILLEVSNVLSKQLRNFNEADLFEIFSKYEVIDINMYLIRKLIPFFKEINLKTSDATILGIAKLIGADLVTWDEQLIKQGGKHIEIKRPDED